AQPLIAAARQDRVVAPDAEGAVAGYGSIDHPPRQVRKKWLDSLGERFGRLGVQPALHRVETAYEPGKLVALGGKRFPARVEGRIRGRSTRRRRIPYVPVTRSGEFRDKRFEELHDVNLAPAQGRDVIRHRAIGDARQAIGVEPGAAQIVLEAQP